MRKKIVAIALIAGIILIISGCTKIRIPQEELAVITYLEPLQGSTNTFVENLSEEESAKVRSILMDAKHNAGIGGCAYTEKISFTFGEQVFLVAYDGCNTICDVQNEKYYEVNRDDWAYIVSLFEHYGGRL